MPNNPLVNSADADKAERILREIQGIMKREGFVLAHQPNGMVLGKVPPGVATQVQVVAVVRLITPDIFEWAKIDWRNPMEPKLPWATEKLQ